MTLNKYLILMSMASIFCWTAWGLVVFYMNPEAGIIALVLFYLSLFLSVVGTFAIVGFILRAQFLQGELAWRQVAVAFRQAFWFGVLAIVALWLQSRELLTWYNLFLLILVMLVFEFFFLSSRRNIRQ